MKIIFLVLTLLVGCDKIEKTLEKNLATLVGRDSLLDQGYIYFNEIGNIRVEFNNLEFKSNPLYTPYSYIGVWVYKRGGDPLATCCKGSSSDCGVLLNSCMIGVGFSNDLGFLGQNFWNVEPPRPFNKDADKFYMDVKVAGADGSPTGYQGGYQPFSGPTNPVGDRELFDVYVGTYYHIFTPDGKLRPINSSAAIGNRTYYTRVDPDFLSPAIPIESRFFSQTPEDPPGSMYMIPHMASWKRMAALDRDLDKRKYVRINEIGSGIQGLTNNDFVELYNPTGFDIFLDDVFLFRYSTGDCKNLNDYSDREDLTGLTIKAKSFLLLARSGSTLLPDVIMKNVIVGDNDCFALATGGKKITPIVETADDNPTEERVFSTYSTRPALKPEPRVIDFIGTEDPLNQNFYLGAPAPAITFNTALSRCADGVDTRNNANDFYVEAATPGKPNQCSFATPVSRVKAGELIISEISVRNNLSGCVDGDDDFIELYNNTDKPINLAGAKLYYITSGGSVSTFYTFESSIIAARSYLVIVSKDSGCFTSTTLSGRNVLFVGGSSGFNLSSATASIVLARNSFSFPDPQNGPTPVNGSTVVIDYVGYGLARVYKVNPSNAIDNFSISYCTGNPVGNNSLDFGIEVNSPGAANSCSGSLQIASLTRNQILITEISPNGTGACSAVDDFVEIYNTTLNRINLAGGKLYYITSGGTVTTAITFGYQILEPNSYAAVINNTGGCYTTGSLPGRNIAYASGNLGLSGTGASVALGRNDGSLLSPQPGGAIVENTAFILDYVGYYTSSIVFKGALARPTTCTNNSIIRNSPTTNTDNNQNDFLNCGALNGNPGAAN
ncbi:MAG: lamin tail domain-containing protein [Leptospiraceae bacterium]|nr:lamin tail domain-containing protein [Leptospiraceae bacterium]